MKKKTHQDFSVIALSCITCNGDFEVKHQMGEDFEVEYCPFCGEEIIDTHRDEIYLDDEFSEEDEDSF